MCALANSSSYFLKCTPPRRCISQKQISQKCAHTQCVPLPNRPTQVTESSSWVSGFHPPQIHKGGAGNWGKLRECAVGFNQTLSESLFEDRNGKFTIVSRANSNPQVFRLNLLNFLNAAPHHAPMLRLATIYKVSHALNFLVKQILFSFSFLFFSLQGGVVWIVVRSPLGEYSGSNFFEMAKLSTRGR